MLIQRCVSSCTKHVMKPLPIKFVVEHGKIKDIKIFSDMIGKDVTNVKKFNVTFYINYNQITLELQKQLNKNMPLL